MPRAVTPSKARADASLPMQQKSAAEHRRDVVFRHREERAIDAQFFFDQQTDRGSRRREPPVRRDFVEPVTGERGVAIRTDVGDEDVVPAVTAGRRDRERA